MTYDVREITSPGSGAISIVSVRGGGALDHVRAVFAFPRLTPGRPQLARLAHAGTDLDEALVCALSPDEVEIHLHGSPVLVQALLEALGRQTQAAPRTAEERALALVPGAASASGARILLDQSEGAWRRFVASLAQADAPRTRVLEVVEASRSAAHALRAPIVVLAGAVNAGKSTLFNVLVGSARAITSSEPGTTRDLVRARGRLGLYVVEFVDTAGERELAEDGDQVEIERAGIERALSIRSGADVVLWLAADERATGAPDGAITLHAQSDRRAGAPSPSVSALRDPLAARDTVARLVHESLGLPDDPWTEGAPRAFDSISRATLAELAACATDEILRARSEAVLARAVF